MSKETPATGTTTKVCLRAETLVARLAAADSAEPPNDESTDGRAVTPAPPPRNQSQQIAELKRIANPSSQPTDNESPEAA